MHPRKSSSARFSTLAQPQPCPRCAPPDVSVKYVRHVLQPEGQDSESAQSGGKAGLCICAKQRRDGTLHLCKARARRVSASAQNGGKTGLCICAKWGHDGTLHLCKTGARRDSASAQSQNWTSKLCWQSTLKDRVCDYYPV